MKTRFDPMPALTDEQRSEKLAERLSEQVAEMMWGQAAAQMSERPSGRMMEQLEQLMEQRAHLRALHLWRVPSPVGRKYSPSDDPKVKTEPRS